MNCAHPGTAGLKNLPFRGVLAHDAKQSGQADHYSNLEA